MKCRDCPEGKRMTVRKVMCIPYGMIISAEHECTREGGRRHDRGTADHGEVQREETELQEDRGGAA